MKNFRGYYENAKNYASDSDNQPQTYAAAGLGPTGYAVGYVAKSMGVGKPGAVEESLGITNQKGKDLRGQMDAMSNSYWNTMGGYSNQMTENNKNYLGAMSGAGKNFVDASSALENQYQGQIGQLGDQARAQATDAQAVYTNNVLPDLMNMQDRARSEGSQAMTLAEAQDPNNPVAKGYRDFYETQAGGENKKGLADVGVMQSLGAQAFANQAGSGLPMTGAQQQLLASSSQQQAGAAMGNVQKRVADLRQQGIDQGMLQTQAAYARGQGALDRYRQSTGDIQYASGANIAQQGSLRGEQSGLAGALAGSEQRQANNQYGYDAQMAGISQGVYGADINRQQGLVTGQYGQQMGMLSGDIQASNATQAAKAGMIPGILGAVGGAVGGMYGGPMGAAAGQGAGQGVGQGISAYNYSPVASGPNSTQGYQAQGGAGQGGGGGFTSALGGMLGGGGMLGNQGGHGGVNGGGQPNYGSGTVPGNMNYGTSYDYNSQNAWAPRYS